MLRLYGSDWKTEERAAVELALYSWSDEKRAIVPDRLDRAEHLRRAIRLLIPDEKVLVWHRWMDTLIDEWANNDIVSIWGPSSAGKSAAIGLLSYVDLLAAPSDTLTILITDKLGGHKTRAWSNLLHWRNSMDRRWRVGRVQNSNNVMRLTVGEGRAAGIFCLSTQDGDTAADLKRKLGGHNLRNRLCVDEAQACGDSVLGLKLNLGASGEYKEVLFGNPDSWHNPLGIHSEPADGNREKTIQREVTKWETTQQWHGKRGVCVVLDGRDCPACDSPEEAIRLGFLPGESELENARAQAGGEDSPSFWSLVIGRIAPAGGKAVVLSEADLRLSGALDRRPWAAGERLRIVGIDSSLGGDAAPMVLIEVGEAQEGIVAGHENSAKGPGRMIAQVIAMEYAVIDVRLGDASGQIAQQVVKQVTAWGVEWGDVVIESGGQQGHLIDTIERMVGCPGRIRRVNPAGKVSERIVGHKGEKAKDRYATRAAELVCNVATLVQQRALCGLHKKMGEQMTSRGILLGQGKTDIQKKPDWARENRGKSPDELDALAVGIEEILARRLLRVDETVRAPRGGDIFSYDWMKPKRDLGGNMGRAAQLVKRW